MMFGSNGDKNGENCLKNDWNKFYSMLLKYRFQIDWDEIKVVANTEIDKFK